MCILQRTLKSLGLYRRENPSDPLEVASFLTDQLDGPGRLDGYKYSTGTGTVRHLLKFLDAHGVEQRWRNRLMALICKE